MPRAKGGYKTRRRRKKLLQKAQGYFSARSRLFSVASEAVDHALRHAYRDRRVKKREFRALWIIRINAASRALGLSYSQLMLGLKRADVGLNRKALADIAYNDPSAFKEIVETAKRQLAA